MEEEGNATPLPAALDAISRPGSASTTASAAIAQLPGMPATAASATDSHSPQPKSTSPPASTSPLPELAAPAPAPAPVPAHESHVPEQTSPTMAPAIESVPTLTSGPEQTDFAHYTQPPTAQSPTTAMTIPAPAPMQAPVPAPMPAPMQMPIVPPMPVTMNHHHVASSPAAHAPTPSGNLVCVRSGEILCLPPCYLLLTPASHIPAPFNRIRPILFTFYSSRLALQCVVY
ncbi:hypothetical protein F4777DRAFT_345232 [Nemania sp. FL0916]|nr:hypothetical protein F4777DRAFT_345232 [Nemania sp. FL0916]